MSRFQPKTFTLSRKKRLLILLLVALAVVALLAGTLFRDRAESALRHITYSQKKDFPHNAQANSLFIGMDNDLLVCTNSQVQLFSPTGAVRVKEPVTMSSPARIQDNTAALALHLTEAECRYLNLETDEL